MSQARSVAEVSDAFMSLEEHEPRARRTVVKCVKIATRRHQEREPEREDAERERVDGQS